MNKERILKLTNIAANVSNATFTQIIVRVCEREVSRLESGYGISNVFKLMFEVISQKANFRPCNEYLLEEKYISKGLTFRKYRNVDNTTYKISMGKRTLFEIHVI